MTVRLDQIFVGFPMLMSTEEVIEGWQGEQTTEMEWTDEMIVEQTNADFAETDPDGDLAGDDESDNEDEPPLPTITEALRYIQELERLFIHKGPDHDGHLKALRTMKRPLRLERLDAQVQTTLISTLNVSSKSL
jgi:hypothetical protein